MLESIDSDYQELAHRILLWIAISKVPLSSRWLAEAAVIEPRAELPFDPSKRLKRLENSSF
jgi:hypothetical protein